MERRFPYKVISCSETRKIHEAKKAWLATQGIKFGDYDLKSLPEKGYEDIKYWSGLNFYWCFEKPEQVTAFALKWGMR